MNATPPSLEQRDDWLVDFLLENFVGKHPLFLFSAGAILLGCWLLNPPGGDGARSLPHLLQLFAVIQVYELALLGCAALLVKKSSRDVKNLLLVLAPFALDVSFTSGGVNALMAEQVGALPALTLLGLTLAVSAVKLLVGVRLLGLRLPARLFTGLLLGPLFVLSAPLVGLGFARLGLAPYSGLATGAGLGLLAAVYAALTQGEPAEGEPSEGDPPRAFPFARTAPWILLGTGVHALATTWVYDGPTSWALAPTVLLMGLGAPALFPALRVHARPLALCAPLVAAALVGWSEASAPIWRPFLLAVVAAQLASLRRSPSDKLQWAGLLLVVDLGACGETLPAALSAIGRGPVEPILLLSASAWTLVRRTHPAAPLGLASLGLGLAVRQTPFAPHHEALVAIEVLAAIAYACGRNVVGGRFQTIPRLLRGCGAFCFGSAPALSHAFTPGDAFLLQALVVSGGALALAALFLRDRLCAAAALPGIVIGAARFAPNTASGWGALSMVAAFGLVGGGLALSYQRERLLAWLATRREAGAPRQVFRGESLLALIGSLCFCLALSAGLAPSPPLHGSRGKRVPGWGQGRK